jgi:hypothetical protein
LALFSVSAGQVLKRTVFCPYCKTHYLFALRAIANNSELKCHGYGGSIRISDGVYELLVNDVRITLAAIDSIQSAAAFISSHRIFRF